jgi:endonuclease/exonuclease/phosphatase family metal-dependent hydrolase
VRVVTWNLWWRFGPWEQRRAAILAVLRELRPDVVGLQEVWADDRENLAEWLAEELGLRCIWAASNTPQRSQRRLGDTSIQVGNAVLSRWPVLDAQVARFPGVDDEDERLAVHTRLQTPIGELPFLTTHLSSPVDASGTRVAQVVEVAKFVAACACDTELPSVVTGDMNAWPDSDEVRLLCGYKTAPAVPGLVLMDAWEFADPAQQWATWDPANPFVAASLPRARIDYILLTQPRPAGLGRVLSVRRAGDQPVGGVWPSDHFAVVADLATEAAG